MFNCLVASQVNKKHSTFSEAEKHCRNLALRIVSCRVMGKKVKYRCQLTIFIGELDLNICINHGVITNSIGCFRLRVMGMLL